MSNKFQKLKCLPASWPNKASSDTVLIFQLYLPNTKFDLLGVLYIDVASQMLLIVTADLELYDLTCRLKLRQRVSVKLPEVLVKI